MKIFTVVSILFALFVVLGATAIVRARRDSSSSGDGEGEEEEGLMDGDQKGVVPAVNLPQGWKQKEENV